MQMEQQKQTQQKLSYHPLLESSAAKRRQTSKAEVTEPSPSLLINILKH